MNFLLALSVLCGFAAKLTTVSGLNSTAPTTTNATMNATLAVTSSGCRGQLKVYNNFVESPGYPFRYPNNMDCRFWVPINQGKALRIRFDYFHLESHPSCGYDYLRIRNDMGVTYSKYCGLRYGKTVLVTGSRASFHFHSDSSVQRKGFRLHLSIVSLACPQVVNNTMESPGYPSSYSHRMDCTISVPIPLGANMRVSFQVFYIYRRYWSCRYYGSLEIMNENGTSFGRYCGSRNGQAVVVNGGLVVLRVRSGYYGSNGRFRLLFTPVYPTVAPSTQPPAPTTYPACPQVVNNTMESPGYPSSYSHRMDCTISVPIPLGANMRVSFQVFYIYRRYWSCRYYGSLEIMNENGTSFGRYCGSRNGQAVVVNGGLVVLRVRSGYYGSNGRFRLLFTPVYPTVAPSTQPPAPTTYPACPQVVNNTMESPGYPRYYSHRMDCTISVPIPLGANMRVSFQVFYIYRRRWNCWYYGSLEIMNENGTSFGRYCGYRNGQAVVVNGGLVVLRVRSGYYGSNGRFRLLFTPVYPTVAPSTQPPVPTTYPACPQVVNNTMESPGYPSSYSHRMDCNISVPIPLGANMRIYFQVFYILDYGWNCRNYGLLDIMNENGNSFGQYCGNHNGQSVLVNGSLVVLSFRSGIYGSSGRFRLLFIPFNATPSTAMDVTSSGCRGQLQLYNNFLESPGYPFRYPNNMDCYFWVPIPQGKALKIVFDVFNLESHSSCGWDYLRIRNDKGYTYGKYCGVQSGKIVLVTGSRASFHFHTDSSVQRKGFRLYFSTTSLGCSPIVNNTWESPGYPGSYPRNLDCNISVPIPSGAEMRIFFQAFYLPNGSYGRCWYDYLVIRNENGADFGTYCGSRAWTTVVVNGTNVVLTFHSDSHNNGGRFRLLFNPIYPLPTSHPSSSQLPPSNGSDAQSQLRKLIANLRDILVQIERVVDNQLGGPSSGNFTKRDHIARINDAVKDVETAMKRAGQQKRNLDTVTFEQLKKRAAEVIAKMEDKEGQFKERAQLDVAKGKRQVEDQKLTKEREESIQKNELKEEKKEA
ncbi:cubilin-like [Acropora muricata]|uniref:cubilin-like n=1 Tax=Acropora muricata TaxID=159855 RepID=UPI0034E40BA0